jgi:PRC-barrel domain
MTGAGSGHERIARGRARLGDGGQGGERLAGVLRLGREEPEAELERTLAELTAKVAALEAEVRAIRGLGETHASPAHASALPTVELRRSAEPGDRDYELHRCQGFDVYSGDERLGVVEGVVYGSRPDRPDLLEVRGRRFGRRPLFVPVEDVEAIEPDEAAVVVRAGRSPASRRRLSAAVARLRSPLAHG